MRRYARPAAITTITTAATIKSSRREGLGEGGELVFIGGSMGSVENQYASIRVNARQPTSTLVHARKRWSMRVDKFAARPCALRVSPIRHDRLAPRRIRVESRHFMRPGGAIRQQMRSNGG
jgi:hypothetical protein